MSSDDTEYYRMRAATELELASTATDKNIGAIHAELARQYQALLDQPELRPALRSASG